MLTPATTSGRKSAAPVTGAVGHGGGNVDGETVLEGGYAVESPAANELVGRAGKVIEEYFLFLPNGTIKHVADDQVLANLLRGERLLSRQVVPVLDAAIATRLEP